MNSPVEIPIGDLATALPGTPLEQALLPNLRMDGPDALSQVEAEQARDNAQELLQQKAIDVLKQAQDSERLAQGAIFPSQSELREVSFRIACAVVRTARDANLGRAIPDAEIEATVRSAIWTPSYIPILARE